MANSPSFFDSEAGPGLHSFFRNMARLVLFLSLFFILTSQVLAQDFNGRVGKAKAMLASGKGDEALKMVTEILKDQPGNPEALFLLGKVYMAEHQFRLATLFLGQAIEKSKNPGDEWQLTLGEAFQKAHQFEEALDVYQKISPMGNRRNLLVKRIAECRVGQELKENPLEVKISNLGEKINSEYHDRHPLVTADYMQIFFSREQPDRGKPGLEIFQSFHKGLWEKAMPLPAPINDNAGAELSGIRPDGQVLYFYRPTPVRNILQSEFKDGKWSRPETFSFNSRKNESSLSLSADGKTLFFVSGRNGNKDIFYCRKQGSSWSKPKSVGSLINTAEDEESPWLDADGKYLYFSSKGHSGMGGFDIFRVDWSQSNARPENIGYPINSASDDMYYMLMPDEKTAFYSSGRDGGFGGDDLYSIRMGIGKTPQLFLFKGTVSENTGLPVEANVLVTETGASQPVAKLKSHPETGTFVTMLPTGKIYSVLVEREGYLFSSDLLDLTQPENNGGVDLNFRMQKLNPGTSLVLSNLFFEPGKSSLRKESSPELMRILSILRQNPGIKAEIAGHLDPGGPEDVLLKLSENRAQAVVDYLVATGIKSSRLLARGYGSSKPVAGNNTPAGREENRRIEFRILSIQ
jgi:outer membrane protein OmpA-like peptidoglycan-associated protein/tetratricopeptide (TPR) repeat protein